MHGTVRTLGTRDCSVQRRRQKVIEEAPPPALVDGLDEKLRAAAKTAALEVGYSGVGTVEFLVRGDEYYFLEMNPRLQVEHAITEEITGLDLVEIQIRIARGESIAEIPVEEKGASIEVRICAEDPDSGFLPSPGTIACFDPALGPGTRLDTGVTSGSVVPHDFDSLIAKLITTGADRHEARARMLAALGDFDLVIEGGATNKAFLIEILRTEELARGGVDTTWLDRFVAARGVTKQHAFEALVAAAILTYQTNRRVARANFYADTSNLSPERVPPSTGQQVDLTLGGESYRLEVVATGGWSYRVHLDGRVIEAALREQGKHLARLQLGDRVLRLLYDVSSGIRIEIEGAVHCFGLHRAGQVRAGTPAMVVAIHAKVGDTVTAGQSIGVLEAMKMEIAFTAPVGGVIAEVLVGAGQQVAAGDPLMVIEPTGDAEAAPVARLEFPEVPDPLAPVLGDGTNDVHDPFRFTATPRARREAFQAVRGEVRGIFLGYDADPGRAERLAEFLETPIRAGLSASLRWRLAEIREELAVAVDIDELFVRAPSISASGALGPSNNAQLRMFLRRIRAGGSGVPEEFLERLLRALAHYGITSLDFTDTVERAVLRLLASQRTRALRDRFLLAILNRLRILGRSGSPLMRDESLRNVLERVVALRGLVPDSVSDAAIQAIYDIFRRPEIEDRAFETSRRVENWLNAAASESFAPPEESLLEIAAAPHSVFARIRPWFDMKDPRRRGIAAAALVRRLYAPSVPASVYPIGAGAEVLRYPDGRLVVGIAIGPGVEVESIPRVLADLEVKAPVSALEILQGEATSPEGVERVLTLASEQVARVTFTSNAEAGGRHHRTFFRRGKSFEEDIFLAGLHPEVAARLDFGRLTGFDLDRHPAPEGIYLFSGKSRELPSDERLFVIGDIPGFWSTEGQSAESFLPSFEQTFYEATRSLRELIALRDQDRRLQWNRIFLVLSPTVTLDESLADPLSQRLAPAARHLGLEKVIVRLSVAGPGNPWVEVETFDLTGTNLEVHFREPHHAPLHPRSEYERRIGEARRHHLIPPYEIVRLLTGKGVRDADEGTDQQELNDGGTFEEYDVEAGPDGPVVRSVKGRPYGSNEAAVVFGIISTPTAKFPEGLRRVLILSDPTGAMGALAGPECERIIAAIGLAEQLGLPVEWVPVSSGAKIAMDSGTETLDATARVARRIITFTQAGGTINILIDGVNVGAQSYFDALATMLIHCRGILVMTTRASMVLTGRAALEASGAVSAEDESAIGGLERIMGPNGQSQYSANDLGDAYRILFEYYRYSYVASGESRPRRFPTTDPVERDIRSSPCEEEGFQTVGEILDEKTNPGRKRPFPMRSVMAAVVDQDGGWLERWAPMVGAETAIVWDAHIGGYPVSVIGIESRNVNRDGYRPHDGPGSWSGGTLFPLSSKKVARAINAASGVRPVVVLANLSGFDGSPESMRKLQLEYGAEIARAVVNFEGPIFFLVVARYHGGAYVVFSQALNEGLETVALTGSYASVIGGSAAAAVVFPREVRALALKDPRVETLQSQLDTPGGLGRYERTLTDVILEKRSELAKRFDAIHSVERAREVGSVSGILEPRDVRPWLVQRVASWYEGGETGKDRPAPNTR